MLIGFAAAAVLLVYLAGNRGKPPDTGQTVTESRTDSAPPGTLENKDIKLDPTAIPKRPDLSFWQVDSEGWLYTNTDGKTYSSTWETVDGQLYYFKENGRFATGWNVIDGATYLFDPAGRMFRDMWTSSPDGKLYRLSADGAAVTGWYTESDGRVFHMASDGSVQYGWQEIDGRRHPLFLR